jgi:ATP-binding cassette subfamily B (MDR/TAP) protein 1
VHHELFHFSNLAKFEEGIGEKVGTFIFFESTFVTGVIIALALGWELALICMASLPVSFGVAVIVSWVNKTFHPIVIYYDRYYFQLSTKFSKQEMEAYGAAGSIAEEVLSSVRTVVAFDGQEKEITRYKKHLQSAEKNNITKNLFSGISNGFMWFFLFASYALAFWYGVGLILEERNLPKEDIIYTPANMMAVCLVLIQEILSLITFI